MTVRPFPIGNPYRQLLREVSARALLSMEQVALRLKLNLFLGSNWAECMT
jgi:hypothetical protein